MDKRNRYLNQAFIVIVCLSSFLDVFNVFLKSVLGFMSTSSITIGMYILVMVYCMYLSYKAKCFICNNLYKYILLLVPFLIMFIMFPLSRSYLISQEMLLIYVFFILLSVFVIKNIEDFSGLILSFKIPGFIISCLCFLMLNTCNYQNYLNYMKFSYSLLPISAFLYLNIRKTEKHIFSMIGLLFNIISMLTYGARSPILFLLIFIVLVELFFKKKLIKGAAKIFSLVGTVYILYAMFSDDLLTYITLKAQQTGSYVLMRIVKGSLFESKERELIYEICRSFISQMGLKIKGPFYDRILLDGVKGGAYSHNIIYETIISFGWILGAILIIGFLILIISAASKAFKNDNNRLVFILVIMCFFARYLISGSFIMEGQFYIGTSLLVALNKTIKGSDGTDALEK